jgi:type IV pilus assembly protein PilM
MASLAKYRGKFRQKSSSPFSSLFPRWGEKSYLSLDIGSSSVKMLEIRGDGNDMRILNADIASLPANAVQSNMVQDSESVTRAIRMLLEEHRIKATEVITAVPGPAVIIKRANFPVQEPQELHETILFEAGNFIPESLDNVNLDYQVFDRDSEADNVDVLLVAVRKDVIKSFLTPISDAGLAPIIVDVDYFALENMFELNHASISDETIALINIGARYSSINIMKAGRSAFTGDVPFGGRQFTDMLAQELGLSDEQAEAVKITGRTEGRQKEEAERVITIASGQFFDEIQRAFSFFWTDPGDHINSIYLSGGSAQLPGLASAMSERLQVPVEVVDPFRLLTISRQADNEFIRQHASALAVSVGLATRRPGDK